MLFAAIIKLANSFYNHSFVPAMKEALEKAYKAIAIQFGADWTSFIARAKTPRAENLGLHSESVNVYDPDILIPAAIQM